MPTKKLKDFCSGETEKLAVLKANEYWYCIVLKDNLKDGNGKVYIIGSFKALLLPSL